MWKWIERWSRKKWRDWNVRARSENQDKILRKRVQRVYSQQSGNPFRTQSPRESLQVSIARQCMNMVSSLSRSSLQPSCGCSISTQYMGNCRRLLTNDWSLVELSEVLPPRMTKPSSASCSPPCDQHEIL